MFVHLFSLLPYSLSLLKKLWENKCFAFISPRKGCSLLGQINRQTHPGLISPASKRWGGTGEIFPGKRKSTKIPMRGFRTLGLSGPPPKWSLRWQILGEIKIKEERRKRGKIISTSSSLVGFGELNDNTIKGLTSLLSVEQEIEFIAYICELWNKKCI